MLDLFSGIGGFSLAAGWVGIETAAFCEIDGYCQRVLRRHWPMVPIYSEKPGAAVEGPWQRGGPATGLPDPPCDTGGDAP